MFSVSKDLSAVTSHSLEYAVTVKQTMIIHADLGVLFVEQFAVDKNLQ